jgi:hypothetical protein
MVSLQKFLADHEIDDMEDCKIVLEKFEPIADRQLRLFLSAWPWWRNPLPPADDRAELTLDLIGIERCRWPLYWGKLQIRDVFVLTSGHTLRDFGPWLQVYGAAPVPDPVHLFAEFHDLCASMDTMQSPIEYTGGDSVEEFERIVSNNCYFMFEAPADVIEAVRPLLDSRSVRYTCLPGRESKKDWKSLIEVVLGDRWFVCRDAQVFTPN